LAFYFHILTTMHGQNHIKSFILFLLVKVRHLPIAKSNNLLMEPVKSICTKAANIQKKRCRYIIISWTTVNVVTLGYILWYLYDQICSSAFECPMIHLHLQCPAITQRALPSAPTVLAGCLNHRTFCLYRRNYDMLD
jgi:hypothetical protein